MTSPSTSLQLLHHRYVTQTQSYCTTQRDGNTAGTEGPAQPPSLVPSETMTDYGEMTVDAAENVDSSTSRETEEEETVAIQNVLP